MFIKRVELSHFKSFGGTTAVPLLPGFTVVSGPNGSGKSNILDALLFALGLSGSKGMRAERLPDLVNQNHSSRSRSTVEASVTVTFQMEPEDAVGSRAIAAPPESPPESPDEVPDASTGEAPNASTPDAFTGEAPEAQGLNPDLNGAELNGSDPNEADLNETNLNEADLNGVNLNGVDLNGHGLPKTPPAPEPDRYAFEDEPDPLLQEILATGEWKVTRKLRVTPQGTYTSNYYINDQPCTLTQLHDHLHRFHVYPEGYNVVLQGDVTSIISMNPRERREIIDELAGVAAFDRKIIQATGKLDAVKEREEQFRIVERELIAQRDRLAQDRIKAEKYQALRAEFQDKSQWEAVLHWRDRQRQAEQLQQQLEASQQALADYSTQLQALAVDIAQATESLEELNRRVKALGEDEQLGLQATLATRQAELRQLQRQEQALITASQETATQLGRTQRELHDHRQALQALQADQQVLDTQELVQLRQARDAAQQTLEASRESAQAIASASAAWIQQQTELRHRIESRLQELEPGRREQATLQERVHQLQQKIQEHRQTLEAIAGDLAEHQQQQASLQTEHQQQRQQVQQRAQALSATEAQLKLQQETSDRLLREQRDKQRQLDRLEAQVQAMQDAHGTGATRLLTQANLPGICGLVAQLGRVEAEYQLALEIAAGGRLGHLVVEDDGIAAAGIELLKQKRAGRATFLPLNKIRAPRLSPINPAQQPRGFIDYASRLIDCDDRYRVVFAHVFGNTVVFSNLQDARPHIGRYRIVTLDGELLDASGAMTGGSTSSRQGSLHFGVGETGESAEVTGLRDRLQEIDHILDRCQKEIHQASASLKSQSQALMDARQLERETHLKAEQLQQQLAHLVAQEGQVRAQLSQHTQELSQAQTRLKTLEKALPLQEAEVARDRQQLTELEQSQAHSEWQQAQTLIQQQEATLSDRQLALRAAEQRCSEMDMQRQRLQEKIEQAQQRVQEYRQQQTSQLSQRTSGSSQQDALNREIAEIQTALSTLEHTLSAEKQERDRVERQLRDRQTLHQQTELKRQHTLETQQARQQDLAALQEQLAAQQAELPDPLPEIPDDLGLEQLQQQVRSLQRRMQAMEPVNMLALEEHDRTQGRLDELSQKLSTLAEERSELLLRIENFTTLRQRAFKEAFDAVNGNFQTIFAELSDGDGYLQLDDPHDPFSSGLNLVAHPKGKPVRRLASMSGGEKSLTALSFIFALQRYRPSPFYAFDEVDMFLDGANVERLARMIKHQTQQAQFIVVSLRRPMIEAAQRTIGVTQARGAYTQVLGIDLQGRISG
ncbi:MAG: chromosome segregation protein SMC [Synechococcales cyanobacterium K44_A2020_017]|nr:chromosome segregation protein SMC [Synechococcales cyanobacterium K32_A2020_035]MBF2093514.1 chromosome segregation protein SMC [Synechococcales cyanobacterium K44_A2020_017]